MSFILSLEKILGPLLSPPFLYIEKTQSAKDCWNCLAEFHTETSFASAVAVAAFPLMNFGLMI